MCRKGVTTLLDLAKKENVVVIPFLIFFMKPSEFDNIIYGVYARKSSESEDRQVQSIERQIDDFIELQQREQLTFYEVPIEESQSAFSVGREGFNKLVSLTKKGKVNAWLCWHANRLSRNPIDAGVIIDLLDRGLLHHIRTPSRIYLNTPTDKMMLQIEFTMSKKDSDDKSMFVKSGLKKRYKKGLPNGKAPIGFLNDKTKDIGDRDWLVDKERFDKLKTTLHKVFKR
jgi:DNA invertase Pin-like site-specific DNA recombinase